MMPRGYAFAFPLGFLTIRAGNSGAAREDQDVEVSYLIKKMVPSYDDDDDDSEFDVGLDEEELRALERACRPGSGFDDVGSDEDDADDKLLQSVQKQVASFFSQKSVGKDQEVRDQEDEDEDEAVLQSLRSVCDRVDRNIHGSGLYQVKLPQAAGDPQPGKGQDVLDSSAGVVRDRVERNIHGSQLAQEKPPQAAGDLQPTSLQATGDSCVKDTKSASDKFLETLKAGNSFLFDSSAVDEPFPDSDVPSNDGFREQQGSQVMGNSQLLQFAIDKNRQCQEMLQRLLLKVQLKKKANAELQRRVKTLVGFEKYCKKRVLPRQNSDAKFVASVATSHSKTGKLGKPQQVAGPEKNKDVDGFKMLQSRAMFFPREWSPKESAILKNAVKMQVQQHLFMQAMDALVMDLDTEENLEARKEEINNISDAEVSRLVHVVDWNNVARGSLPGRSQKECKARWLNHEDKLINHEPWSKEEDVRLLKLATEFELSDWVTVAERLGTHRTAAQCLIRYQRSLNANILLREWTAEEDEQLKTAVEMCGDKDWETVAACLEGRTGRQAMHRWQNVLQQGSQRKKGRWSVEEDKRLMWAVLIFGAQQWRKIAMHVPGRTDIQCRERWRNVLDPELKHGDWSGAEDARLEKAVARHGQHRWSAVAEMMKPRTDNQCWRRWMALHPEFKDEFHRDAELKRTCVPTFGKRKKECPDLELSDFVAGYPSKRPRRGGKKQADESQIEDSNASAKNRKRKMTTEGEGNVQAGKSKARAPRKPREPQAGKESSEAAKDLGMVPVKPRQPQRKVRGSKARAKANAQCDEDADVHCEDDSCNTVEMQAVVPAELNRSQKDCHWVVYIVSTSKGNVRKLCFALQLEHGKATIPSWHSGKTSQVVLVYSWP